MLYKTLIATTIFFTLLFFILFFRALNYKKLKNIWIWAQSRVKEKLKIQSEIEKAESKGEKPFLFEKGATVIYAKDKKTANLKYQRLLIKSQGRNYKKTA